MKTTKSNKANLENKRFIFFEVGVILALAGVLAAFEWNSEQNRKIDLSAMGHELIDEEIIEVTVHKKEKPEMPKPQIIRPIVMVDNTEDIIEDIEVDTEIKDDTKNNLDFLIDDEPGDKDIEEDVIFTVVEQNPSFSGGMTNFYKFLRDHIEYPEVARNLNISGKVYVEFIVWKDGSIREVSLKRGIGGGCDEEAMRVISSMPRWDPGKQRSVPVNVKMVLPVNFVLN